jgi:hypothetical protein
MTRPPIYSKRYYFNTFGSFIAFMLTDILMGLYIRLGHGASLWLAIFMFIYLVTFTIIWMLYVEWLQGHRKHIWTKYEFEAKWVVRPTDPEALRRERPIQRNIENIK